MMNFFRSLFRGRPAPLSEVDLRLRAASAWGPPDDPERAWFMAGWDDCMLYGQQCHAPPKHQLASYAAYASGYIASRDRSPDPHAWIPVRRLEP